MAKGENVAKAAQELLVQPKTYGEACVDLIGRLQRDKQFSEADVWKQVRLAVEFGVPGTARRIAAFTDVSEKQLAQAIDKPNIVIDQGASSSKVARELLIIAIGRLARTDVERAAKALERIQTRLSGEELAAAWAHRCLCPRMRRDTGARAGVRFCHKRVISGARVQLCARLTGSWLPKPSRACLLI
jgi:soluble lytic murein transglycosylase